jgi:hypothetical protein
MNNVLERIWKEVVMADRGTIPRVSWEDLGKSRKFLVRVSGIPAKI